MFKRNPEILTPLIKELESHVAVKHKRNASISRSDVAWQIDHSLKVINLVSESILNSDPEAYENRFNKWRLLLFTIGYIPRGKAKAPKIVQPPQLISSKDIMLQANSAYGYIEKLKTMDKDAHFKHFVFGVLNKDRTIRFLQLHTKHHIKIIKDIIK